MQPGPVAPPGEINGPQLGPMPTIFQPTGPKTSVLTETRVPAPYVQSQRVKHQSLHTAPNPDKRGHDSFRELLGAKVQGNPLEKLVMIELFSGTAGLTAEVRKLGLKQSIGIDAHVTAHTKAPVIRIDLSKAEGQVLMWEILDNPRVVYVHAGPPCGTSSRARDIRRRRGPDPKPLRSILHPDGLPGLQGIQATRVRVANELYSLSGQVMRFCVNHGLLCSIENPKRSYAWLTRSLRQHVAPISHSLHSVIFDHCCYGSRRKKGTKLLVNDPCFLPLAQLCPGDHEHEPWGLQSKSGWATAQEVEYPHQLCNAIAKNIHELLLQLGAIAPACDLASSDPSLTLASRAATGIQPRGKRLRPLMREHAQVVRISGPKSALATLPHKVTKPILIPRECHAPIPHTMLPPGAKQLRTLEKGDGGSSEAEIEFGIPWTHEQFIAKAAGLSHPGHFLDGVHPVLKNHIQKLCSRGYAGMAQDRTAAMRKWIMRSQELRASGEDGKEKSPEHVKKILGRKNLKLLAEMLAESSSEDQQLPVHIAKGFDLMGEIPAGGDFNEKASHATLLPEQVREISELSRLSIGQAVRRSANDEHSEEIYKITMDEVARGWMTGPYELSALPPKSVLTRRFGISQSSTLADGTKTNKVRPIDDFSESLINSTNHCREAIVPMGVDMILAALAMRCRLKLGERLLGKAYDLRKAYKNLPLAEESLNDAFICVFSKNHGRPMAFQSRVLPFGARAAVMGFCRTSMCIWRLGVETFGLHWTVYFDDFFTVAAEEERQHVGMAADLLFELLGWEISSEKGGAFSTIAKILGVQIDLGNTYLGTIEVGNVLSRVKEIAGMIDKVLSGQTFSAAEMRSLRGRLVFAEAQIFGRLTGIHLRRLSRWENVLGRSSLDEETKSSLCFIRDRILTPEPRKILAERGKVYHLYTDASYENGRAGLGGVLYDEAGSMLSFYSCELDESLTTRLNPEGKKTIIYEMETLAAWIGAEWLLDPLSLRPCDKVVLFIDNEATLAGIIAGKGTGLFGEMLVHRIMEWEFASRICLWCERVPSSANVADLPSRQILSAFNENLRIMVDVVPIVDDLTSQARPHKK